MLHPVREWHDNVLSSGLFYGSVIEAAGLSALVPGYRLASEWASMWAPILAVIGRHRGQE